MSAFGTHLRAARLGYRHVPALDAFVRITGDGPFRVEIVREAKDMRNEGEEHRCWWEGDPLGERMLALSPALRAPLPLPCVIWINDDGERPAPSDTEGR
jgi:hypothetical protein